MKHDDARMDGNPLREDRVKTWCISPGYFATGLGGDAERNRQMDAIDPAIRANFVREVVEGARDQDVGKAIRVAMALW